MVPELLVSDFEASRAFYVDLVRFIVCFEREHPPFAYLDLGGAQLMIEEDHAEAWRTGNLQAPRGRGCNLQIEVEDTTDINYRLQEAGYPLFRGLTDTWYNVADGMQEGQRELLVQDPDGYLLRFVEPLGNR